MVWYGMDDGLWRVDNSVHATLQVRVYDTGSVLFDAVSLDLISSNRVPILDIRIYITT
jgi:hypothetical protein